MAKMVFLKCDICTKLALEIYSHVREEFVYWLYTCLNLLVPLSPVPTTLRPSTFLLYSNARLPASAAPVAGVNTDHHEQIPLSISSVSASSFSCYVTSVLGFPLECFQTYRPATQTIQRPAVVLMKLVLGNIITQVGYTYIPYLNLD